MRICCYFKPLLFSPADGYKRDFIWIVHTIHSHHDAAVILREHFNGVLYTCVHTRTQFVVVSHYTLPLHIIIYIRTICIMLNAHFLPSHPVNVVQKPKTFHHRTQSRFTICCCCYCCFFVSLMKNITKLFFFLYFNTGNPITVNLRSFHYNSVTNCILLLFFFFQNIFFSSFH